MFRRIWTLTGVGERYDELTLPGEGEARSTSA